jgi:tetratricopeptide (TPR) repeat protein
MQEDVINGVRRILPRWRSLPRTPVDEISPNVVRTHQDSQQKNAMLENALGQWQHSKHLADAADIVDAALVTGDYKSAVPAAMDIVANGNAVVGLEEAARQVLGLVNDRPVSLINPEDEWKTNKIWAAIVVLKSRLSVGPRDALSALEIARLQSLIGQTKSARRYVDRAVAIAPNDRYVLRSAAKFWVHEGDVERALDGLWASDAARSDPWIQAAEISVANICEKPSRWAAKMKKEIFNTEPKEIRYSELAAGLATLELQAGAPKNRVRKFLKISLATPTENALAQAIWARRAVGFEFNVSGHLKTIANANEARARALYDAGAYSASVQECWSWHADESFSSRAPRVGAFLCLSLLARYEEALQFAASGLRANPNDPMLINDKVVALALGGRVQEAAMILPQLEAFESDAYFKPFVHAGRGLVAFRLGDFSRGRHYYQLAIEYCQKLDRLSLARNATMYWLEQELFAMTISVESADKVVRKLDDYYAKDTVNAPIWRSRREIVSQLTEEAAKRESVIKNLGHDEALQGTGLLS